MKDTRVIMGMPITVEVVPPWAGVDASPTNLLEEVFSYFMHIDERFSPYKPTSEVTLFNSNLRENPSFQKVLGGPRFPSETLRQTFFQEGFHFEASVELREVLDLAEKTRRETSGYFDIQRPDGTIDPSGIVKGWVINNAADMLVHCGCKNFYIEAGGDIQAHGKNSKGEDWSVGIKNPFNPKEIVKVIYLHPVYGGARNPGTATSGSYERGRHIYNPHAPEDTLDEVLSITVVGPNVLEADRFATAAFAMGGKGVEFIEQREGFEAYSIDKTGIATMTSGFSKFTH